MTTELELAMQEYEQTKQKLLDAISAYKTAQIVRKLKVVLAVVVVAIVIDIGLTLLFTAWVSRF